MTGLDFSILTDDQLVELIRAGLQDAVRRGHAVEAAVRAAGLDEAEKARIAKEAADREARRIHEEETRRIAAEAAAKVRREAEAGATQAKQDAQKALWAKKDALARKARAIFSDFTFQNKWEVKIWKNDSTKEVRVFFEFDYDSKIATYYHTGNGRTKPGTVEVFDKDYNKLTGPIRDFAKELCETWNSMAFEVPADSYREKEYWILYNSTASRDTGSYRDLADGGGFDASKGLAKRFATEEEAAAFIPTAAVRAFGDPEGQTEHMRQRYDKNFLNIKPRRQTEKTYCYSPAEEVTS
jgi:hypothetical protein